MSEKETVKAAFVKDSAGGEIVAVFPEEKYGRYGSDVVMYVHNGQHGVGSLEWAREQEKPNSDEIAPLYNELRARGYEMIMVTL